MPISAVIGLALLCLLSGCAATEVVNERLEPQFRVRIKNISARALISVIADLSKLNVVVGDELKNDRRDVSEDSIGLRQLLDKLVSSQGLMAKSHHEVLIIGSRCRLSELANSPGDYANEEPLSGYFQSVTTKVWIDILSNRVDAPINVVDVNAQAPLTLRITDIPARLYLTAIIAVQGWSLTEAPNKKLRALPNRKLKECGAPAATPADKVETALATTATPPNRPCRVPTRLRCMPLETYALDEVILLGYLEKLSHSTRFAIFESSDGVVRYAKVGDYVGTNFGMVKKVTETGVEIIELAQGANGEWTEQIKTLAYGY